MIGASYSHLIRLLSPQTIRADIALMLFPVSRHGFGAHCDSPLAFGHVFVRPLGKSDEFLFTHHKSC